MESRSLLISLLLLIQTALLAQPGHEAWDKLLQQYVDDRGRVDYAGFKTDEAKLDGYLQSLRQNPAKRSWSRAEQLAYWINTYNAFTIKLILENYPVESIRDLHDGNPWDVSWIRLGGAVYSLNQIEHNIIRPQFKDARIHFAVNCAARSCPPLLNKAYKAVVLDHQLRDQTRKFINNPRFNTLREEAVTVSRIFDWYKEDFGNLHSYLNQYADTPIQTDASVRFKAYDWSLNDR